MIYETIPANINTANINTTKINYDYNYYCSYMLYIRQMVMMYRDILSDILNDDDINDNVAVNIGRLINNASTIINGIMVTFRIVYDFVYCEPDERYIKHFDSFLALNLVQSHDNALDFYQDKCDEVCHIVFKKLSDDFGDDFTDNCRMKYQPFDGSYRDDLVSS